MGMALALEHTMLWLREKNGWEVNQCGVQYDALPAYDAGPFYIGIDDAGIEPGDDRTDSLKEILNISIGIWRRPEHLQKDRRGMMKLPSDKYRVGAWTLHDLERAVLVHKSGANKKNGLHGNYEFRLALNARYNLPDPEAGAEFTTPLFYRGRGRMESISIEGSAGTFNAYYGYRLRFRGLLREQKLRGDNDAIG